MLPTWVLWSIFIAVVSTMLYLDLHVFHKKDTEPTMKESLKICSAYMLIAVLFGLFVIHKRGYDTGMLFFTGYLVEFSLSMDNIFVISLVFSSLCIPAMYQHRVLFWGVLGAVVLRAVMIFLGAQLVSNFHWILYIFSAFLIITGGKLLFSKPHGESAEKNKIAEYFAKRFRVTQKLHHQHFFIKLKGKHYATPLFLALLTIEMMDVIFAVDSIPAIFLITEDVFVVYTSNIFAILGLRSLYFLLAGAANRFVYLKTALAVILIFIGVKIFMPAIFDYHITSTQSLIVTFGLLAIGILASLLKTKHHKTICD